jgi:hypothetical protein
MMARTDAGQQSDSSALQLRNAQGPTVASFEPDSNSRILSELHLRKHFCSIASSDAGSQMPVSTRHFLNALLPNTQTAAGASNATDVRAKQPAKTLSGIAVMAAGIVIETSPDCANARYAISDSGQLASNRTSESEAQDSKQLEPILETPGGIEIAPQRADP